MQANHTKSDVKDAMHAAPALSACLPQIKCSVSQPLRAEFLKNRGRDFFNGLGGG